MAEVYNLKKIYSLAEACAKAGFEYGVQKYDWVERGNTWLGWGYDLLSVAQYNLGKIDEAIEKLKPEYKELVYRKYGSDLSNPTIHNDLTKKEYATFYNTVIKHIKMIIEGPKVKTYKSVYKTFSEYTKEEVDAVISTLSEKQKSIIRRREESNITEDEASYYLRSIVPKIKRELQNKKTKKQEKPIVEEIKTNTFLLFNDLSEKYIYYSSLYDFIKDYNIYQTLQDEESCSAQRTQHAWP